jgi:peptidoglycan/xylan/chitin deacetylase (PgdA/CDA1 family)
MYHHVCPAAAVPEFGASLEGWQYWTTPELFSYQLQQLQHHGWRFVSLATYTAGLLDGTNHRLRYAAVTFDDGWRDNFEFALPVLVQKQIPATIFVVSGTMQDVRADRRMTDTQLRQLAGYQIAVGAHSRTHPRLTALNAADLQTEVQGSRHELQDVTGTDVPFFAYPGGRFNRSVVAAVQAAGYTAACSVIGLARNDHSSLFWLYRDVFSDHCTSWRDRLRMSAAFRTCVGWRAARRVQQALEANGTR